MHLRGRFWGIFGFSYRIRHDLATRCRVSNIEKSILGPDLADFAIPMEYHSRGRKGVSNHTSDGIMPVLVAGTYLTWCGGVLVCPVLVSQGFGR